MIYLLGILCLLLGLYFGEKFPDIDQKSWLLHRSVVTHGVLVPLILYLLASNIRFPPLRWFAMGVFLGITVHLAFDLFPRAWSGYALISIPFYGWIPPALSWAWIAFSGAACAFFAGKMVRDFPEAILLGLAVIGVFAYAAQDEAALWRPMAAAAAAIGGATSLGVASRKTD